MLEKGESKFGDKDKSPQNFQKSTPGAFEGVH